MKIKDILTNCNLLEIVGEKDVDVVDITFDSRKVNKGTLFLPSKVRRSTATTTSRAPSKKVLL